MRIQHNIAALNSHRQLTNNNSAVAKNLEKLSSGYRINRAGDDAAGLAISEKMRAQITGLDTASKNAQDGISLVQTAEGALTEVHSMLNRMAELAGQSANGTYQDAVDRENIQKEMDSLRSEIDRISDGTNFNGIKLLDGSMGGGGIGATGLSSTGVKVGFKAPEGKTLQITSNAASSSATMSSAGAITINLNSAVAKDYTEADINKLLKDAGIDASVTLDKDIAHTATMGAITSTKVSYASATVGGIEFKSTSGGAVTTTIAVASASGGPEGVTVNANGKISLNLDADKTYTADQITSLLSKAGIKDIKATKVGTVTAATGNLAGGGGLAGTGLSLQIGESSESFNQLSVSVASMNTTALGIDEIDIGTQDGAKAAIEKIKTAINSVSSTRGDLGAIQNRLEHTINNLGVTSENMSAAESRIRDVDMAKEMMTFTKNNILTQASQAMLAQANQLPQGVLQLLQ